jgi:hypothetical protein
LPAHRRLKYCTSEHLASVGLDQELYLAGNNQVWDAISGWIEKKLSSNSAGYHSVGFEGISILQFFINLRESSAKATFKPISKNNFSSSQLKPTGLTFPYFKSPVFCYLPDCLFNLVLRSLVLFKKIDKKTLIWLNGPFEAL